MFLGSTHGVHAEEGSTTSSQSLTTEVPTTEGNNAGATTDSKTTVVEKAVTPTTESITAVSET